MFELVDSIVGFAAGVGAVGGGLAGLRVLRFQDTKNLERAGVAQKALATSPGDDKEEFGSDEMKAVEPPRSPKAEAWSALFYEYRDFLVSVVDGTCQLSPDKQLYKMLELLNAHPNKLPRHQGTIAANGVENPYMSLTFIYSGENKQASNRRVRSNPLDGMEAAYQATSLFRSIATGYQASFTHAIKSEGVAARSAVGDFAKQYAAHLLLNYRKSPTESSPRPSLSELEERYARQDALNKSAHILKERVARFGKPLSKASLVEEALAVVPTLVDARQTETTGPSKVLAKELTEEEVFDARIREFATFGDEEEKIAQSYLKADSKFIGDDLRDASRSLDKYFFAVDAIKEAGELEEDDRQQVLELAGNNMWLARAELAELVRVLSSGQALNLVRALRVDNRYLAGRQATTLEGQKVTS